MSVCHFAIMIMGVDNYRKLLKATKIYGRLPKASHLVQCKD